MPNKCASCLERSVVAATLPTYTDELEHDGRAYTITVSNLDVLKCEKCDNLVIPDHSLDRLTSELRKQAGLLLPGDIRKKRDNLKLTQKALAGYLNVSESTLCRWETGGQIQQRAMDKLLRLFFDVQQAREYLIAGGSGVSTAWNTITIGALPIEPDASTAEGTAPLVAASPDNLYLGFQVNMASNNAAKFSQVYESYGIYGQFLNPIGNDVSSPPLLGKTVMARTGGY